MIALLYYTRYRVLSYLIKAVYPVKTAVTQLNIILAASKGVLNMSGIFRLLPSGSNLIFKLGLFGNDKEEGG